MRKWFRYLFLLFATISALTMPDFVVGIGIYAIGYLAYLWLYLLELKVEKNN